MQKKGNGSFYHRAPKKQYFEDAASFVNSDWTLSLLPTVCLGLIMNKQLIVHEIIEALDRELQLYLKAAQAAHAEATHEQSKAENKYDTRGLEASYLARGQSRQAAEIRNSIKLFQSVSTTNLPAGSPIDIGALVELKEKGKTSQFYFMGPAGGGTEVTHGKEEIIVITPQSPLGEQLLGRKAGQKVQLLIAGTRSEYQIFSIT